MYDLTNIFEVFLPQLLTYPNPTDPLNGEAAALQMREPERYRQKVIDYVRKYAKPENFPMSTKDGEDAEEENESDFSMSESENDGDDDVPNPVMLHDHCDNELDGASSHNDGAGTSSKADLSRNKDFSEIHNGGKIGGAWSRWCSTEW